MGKQKTSDSNGWVETWLDMVASGQATMSQRVLSSVVKHGGLTVLRREAKRRGIHLLLLKDDNGREIIAASKDAFKVIC